ncbi:major facilitator superfamily domain-containing protein [Piptocephalis cylindrospora]|uniref:Major facilitator superfamily domain-containing protein n=1 Tax=Piptocephalis cylindrospora TaxID=1907219 RepID=A0A4V1IYL2_9FUNG|nr:major facilitator superfamily domain-containing protein [Piptocephalis cylindrospora]|eukprot:RKP14949.1 major facilitator superfamily domain-containing protein [Piptocephalis cylindrospora]
MIGLMLAVFLSSLDQTIVSTALPTIASQFNSLNDVSWVATSYLLTSTAFQPLYGKFSDIFGRKVMLLFAVSVFTLGSILCGAAQSMLMLIVCRALAGLGGGGIMSIAMIVISDIVSLRDRGKYQGFFGGAFALSSVLGPLLGGVFTDHASWRWAFYINIPIAAITIVTTFFFLRLPTPEGSLREKLRRIDYVGTVLLIGAVVLILLATNWGGSAYPWNSGPIIGCYVGGGVLAIAFIVVEGWFAREPVAPGRFFKMRDVVINFAALFFLGMSFFSLIFYLPMFFQVLRGDSATTAGLETLPFIGGLLVASIGGGFLVSKTGMLRPFMILGAALLVLGSGLLSSLDVHSNRGKQLGYQVFSGLGIGFVLQTATVAVQASVQIKDMASATALLTFFRSIGGVVGIAIVGAIFNNKLSSGIASRLPNLSAEEIAKLVNSVEAIHSSAPDIRDAAVLAYMDAFHLVYTVCIPLAGVAFLLFLCLRSKKIVKNAAPPPMTE